MTHPPELIEAVAKSIGKKLYYPEIEWDGVMFGTMRDCAIAAITAYEEWKREAPVNKE